MAELSGKGRKLIDIAMANDEPPSVDASWGTLVSRLTMEAPRDAVPIEPSSRRNRVLVLVLVVSTIMGLGAVWWWSQRRVPVVDDRVAEKAPPEVLLGAGSPRGTRAKGPAPAMDVRELLPAAEAALAAKDPDRAMALLQAHAERAPTDPAAPHRMALRVLALCAKGDLAQARDEATAFLAAHGESQWGDAVRRSCVGG